MSNAVHAILWACIAIIFALFVPEARGADLQLEAILDTEFSTNLFMDQDEETDWALRPGGSLGVSFAEYWSAGYSGELNAYVNNTDLLSHFHTLYLGAHPSWGSEGENELKSELSLGGLFNRELYEEIDMLNPAWNFEIEWEPRRWLRPQLGVATEYRWFYHDTASSSWDTWVDGSLAFLSTATRTSVRPTASLGYRHYTEAAGSDLQADLGLRAGQGLWASAGLQASYFYRLADDENEVVTRKLTLDQFAFVGEEFLFSGHRGHLGFKQLLGDRFTGQLTALVEERRYKDWPALDDLGDATGADRHDVRLTPAAQLTFEHFFDNRRGSELAVHLGYQFIRQWSNDDWYDTLGHSIYLTLWGAI